MQRRAEIALIFTAPKSHYCLHNARPINSEGNTATLWVIITHFLRGIWSQIVKKSREKKSSGCSELQYCG